MADRDAIGFLLTIAGTFLAALGYVLQKAAHIEATVAVAKVPSWKYWKWSTGLVCMVFSAVLVVLASPYLDQSKSAPLGAATLVFNSLLATLLLKERFTVLAALSTLVIVVGTIVAVSSSEPSSKDLTFEDILLLLQDQLVTAYSVIMAIAMPGAAVWVELLTRRSEKTWSTRERSILGVLAPALGGWCNGYTSYAAKALTTIFVKGQAGGAFAGTVGAGALYAYVVLVTVAVLGQVRYLNKGLAYFSALATVPVFQAAIIIANSIAGIVYFGDLRGSSAPWRMGVFITGACVCTSGIVLLRMQRPPPAPESGTAVSKGAAGGNPAGVADWVSDPSTSAPNTVITTNPKAAVELGPGTPVPPEDERISASLTATRNATAVPGIASPPPQSIGDWMNLDVGTALRLATRRRG